MFHQWWLLVNVVCEVATHHPNVGKVLLGCPKYPSLVVPMARAGVEAIPLKCWWLLTSRGSSYHQLTSINILSFNQPTATTIFTILTTINQYKIHY